MTEDGGRIGEAGSNPDRRIGEPAIEVLADPEAVVRAAAERIAQALGSAIERRGRAHWATTGGSSPAGIYRALVAAPLRDGVDWERVELWWGDDRFVPRADALSNVRSADEILLAPGGVPIPATAVHPWPCDEAIERGEPPDWAAARYTVEALREVPRAAAGGPAFDLVLVGVGPDGHLLSVFPGSPAFDTTAVAIGVPAPTHIEPHVPRVTFTPPILDDAGELIVIATGEAKAPVVADLLGIVRDERRWPAQRARRSGAVWLLDDAATIGMQGTRWM